VAPVFPGAQCPSPRRHCRYRPFSPPRPTDGQRESPLTIDLAGLVENVQGAAKEQVAYLVDMAKADALDLLGETRQALVLVDRHV